MKKDLAKKIISISVVSLVIALVITTIVLALVPKRLANPVAEGYATITIYKDNVGQQYLYSNDAETNAEKNHNAIYKKIQELHEESLKDNLLSSMFQGLGKYGIEVVPSITTKVIEDVAKANGNALVFTYTGEKPQVLKINGEVYYNTTAISSTVVEYDMIVMPLNENDSFEECTIYLVDRESSKSSYKLKFLANQGELNDYIETITFGLV